MRPSTLTAPDTAYNRTHTGDRPLDWDFETSRQVMATHARTSFHFATRFLPAEKRHSAIELYAFFRSLDDFVDENLEHASASEIRETLEVWRAWICDPAILPPQPALAECVERVIRNYAIPRKVILEFIDGMLADIERRQIVDERELDLYCYQVASTVGLAMARVLGKPTPMALTAAARLGEAMQRTNILRDIGEDLARDRVYIPGTKLAQYGLSVDSLRAVHAGGAPPPRALRALMQDEIRTIHGLYERALPGIWLLPNDCRFTILLAARLYRHLLTIIERNGFDSINKRAATSHLDKAREFTICAALARFGRPTESPRLNG